MTELVGFTPRELRSLHLQVGKELIGTLTCSPEHLAVEQTLADNRFGLSCCGFGGHQPKRKPPFVRTPLD